MDSFSTLLDIDPHPWVTGSFACWNGQLFPFTHPDGNVYGAHCFLILPGSFLSVLFAEFPGEGLVEAAGLGFTFPSDAFPVPFSTFF